MFAFTKDQETVIISYQNKEEIYKREWDGTKWDEADIGKYISQLNEEKSNIDYIDINYPISKISNKELKKFTETCELVVLDLLGFPDKKLSKNRTDIECFRKNPVYKDRQTMDSVMIIDDARRGRLEPSVFRYLYEANVFNTRELAPSIVLVNNNITAVKIFI